MKTWYDSLLMCIWNNQNLLLKYKLFSNIATKKGGFFNQKTDSTAAKQHNKNGNSDSNYGTNSWNRMRLVTRKVIVIPNCSWDITVEHGRIITPNFLGEHKVITAEQQFLGLILCFFMYSKWPWLLCLFAVLL